MADFTHVQYMLHLRHGTRLFGLPLWPERVVACRVSLSSVSSGFAKLLLVESWSPDLFFVAISLGFATFFYEHNRPSHLMFLVVQIILSCTSNLSLWMFCATSKSTLLLATALWTRSQIYAAQSCSTVIEYTPTHKTYFLFSWRVSLYM